MDDGFYRETICDLIEAARDLRVTLDRVIRDVRGAWAEEHDPLAAVIVSDPTKVRTWWIADEEGS